MLEGYVFVENNIFPTLLAISANEQEHGLMFQSFPPPIMSFVYKFSQVNNFWMHNTPSPLDIVFCNDGEICKICTGEPYSTNLIGNVLSDLVVEFPKGTVSDFEIKLGDKIGLFNPSIGQLNKMNLQNYR